MPVYYQDVEKFCEECGKQLQLKNNRDIQRKRFCSRSCKAKNTFRQYKVNEQVFKQIDTPDKAYWLGYIMADGCVQNNRYGTLYIRSKDKDQLIKFRNFLQSNLPIRKVKNYNVYEILVTRRQIVDDLGKWNIYPNKTLKLKFPNIPEQYYSDFIRGYFDGDGWLCKYGKYSQLSFSISSGSLGFLQKIQEILMKALNLNKTEIRYRIKGYGSHYELSYHGNNQVPEIIQYLLHNSNTKLDRKYYVLREKLA